MKRIIVSSDSTAYHLKEAVTAHLEKLGYDIVDKSISETGELLPYYEAGRRVGEAVSSRDFQWGLLFCGSGMGVNIVANRYQDVYCALCESVHTAALARKINNANVLALGGNIVAHDMACAMAETFFATEFLEGMDGNRQFLSDAIDILHELDAKAHHAQKKQ